MESYPFICLIFTFFMRERLGWVHTFALCVNKLLLEFWHFQLHCLLHLHCSDNSTTAQIHSWVKKRVQSLEKAEKYGLRVKLPWTQIVTPLALFLSWSCAGEQTWLEVMGTVMQPPLTGTCSGGEEGQFCPSFLCEGVCAQQKYFSKTFSETPI